MIEVLARLRLPIKPVLDDEVARKIDLDDVSGIGLFFFDQADGNLYLVTENGFDPDNFEYDPSNGNLYYLVETA